MKKLNEKSPKGWEKTVKSMKKHDEIDNPWALAWWMKKKGYKHGKKKVKESCDIEVWHPDYGSGTLLEFDDTSAKIEWVSPHWNIQRGGSVNISEAKSVILPSFAKYNRITPLSEGIKMEKEFMTMQDYINLMESDETLTVPDQSSTILTGVEKMKTQKKKPLALIDDSPKDDGPYEDNVFDTKDSLNMPKVKDNKIKGKAGRVKDSDLVLGKNDTKKVTEMEDFDDDEVISSDVSMTGEFLTKLLNAASAASVTTGDVNKIVDAVEAAYDGEALDIDDISRVMDSLRDVSECDKESGDGKKAKNGKTQLMGDADEDGDDLTEAFIVPLPQMGAFSEKPDYTGMSEDEIEMAELKRLAGL